MKIKTTSTAYDNDGNVLASYDNEKEFNAEDVEYVVKRFKQKHEKEDTPESDKPLEDKVRPCDEPRCYEDDEEFDDECEDFDGDEILHLEVSLDALKIVGAVAGGLIGLKVLHKLAKAVF